MSQILQAHYQEYLKAKDAMRALSETKTTSTFKLGHILEVMDYYKGENVIMSYVTFKGNVIAFSRMFSAKYVAWIVCDLKCTEYMEKEEFKEALDWKLASNHCQGLSELWDERAHDINNISKGLFYLRKANFHFARKDYQNAHYYAEQALAWLPNNLYRSYKLSANYLLKKCECLIDI